MKDFLKIAAVVLALGLAPREEWGSFTAWYPADLPQSDAQYPVVVMVNGTGVYASKYPAVFEHLASWGFIVVGNEDPSTCTGAAPELASNPLYQDVRLAC